MKINDHYTKLDGLLTDLAPLWLDGDPLPVAFTGLNALYGAQQNTLPSFVYSPFTPPVIVNNAYRFGCNAVVNSYTHSLEDLKAIIDSCLKTDEVWIDNDLDDDLSNRILCVTDDKLRVLGDSDIKLYIHLVTEDAYSRVAECMELKETTTRNRASQIFKKCDFVNRTDAVKYAMKIGITGIV